MDVDLADLEALRRQAELILKPGPGQRVLIMVTDAEPEHAAEEDNVVALFGGPVMDGEALRQAERAETRALLEHYLELVDAGEVRHVALIAGMETNETNMATVQTGMSIGLENHMALFLGGCTLLAKHIQDIFDQAVFGEDEGDE